MRLPGAPTRQPAAPAQKGKPGAPGPSHLGTWDSCTQPALFSCQGTIRRGGSCRKCHKNESGLQPLQVSRLSPPQPTNMPHTLTSESGLLSSISKPAHHLDRFAPNEPHSALNRPHSHPSRAVGAEFVSPALQRGETEFHLFIPESRRDGAMTFPLQEPIAPQGCFCHPTAPSNPPHSML
jgi:hypothetical protein